MNLHNVIFLDTRRPQGDGEWIVPGRRPRAGAMATGRSVARQHFVRDPAGVLMKILACRSGPGDPRGALAAWPRWERFARAKWPTQKIPGARYDLIRVRITRFRGRDVVLPDGTLVQRGMPVGEVHCNNDAILELVRNNGNPYSGAREDLRSLAR